MEFICIGVTRIEWPTCPLGQFIMLGMVHIADRADVFASHGLQAKHCQPVDCIEGFYIPTRRRSTIANLSPMHDEDRAMKA